MAKAYDDAAAPELNPRPAFVARGPNVALHGEVVEYLATTEQAEIRAKHLNERWGE